MTVISLDNIIYSLTYLLTYLQQLAHSVIGLMHCHVDATKSFKPDAGMGQHQRTIGVHYSVYIAIAASGRPTLTTILTSRIAS